MNSPLTELGVGLCLPLLLALGLTACASRKQDKAEAEEEALSRTEFTQRIENFFEYEPLKAGKASQFLIYLTDLSDGSPVEQAEVTLTIRPTGGAAAIVVTVAYVQDMMGQKETAYTLMMAVLGIRLNARGALAGEGDQEL